MVLVRTKTRKIGIRNFWILAVCCCLLKTAAYADDGDIIMQREALLVVDKSGSLKEEKESVRQALRLLKSWSEHEKNFESIDVIAFSNQAKRVEFAEIEDIQFEGSTRVNVGLREAARWVDERVGTGKDLCVIVISDLVESSKKGCSPEKAKEKEAEVNGIIEKWGQYEELSYLFVTWKDKTANKLSDLKGNQRIEKFSYDIHDSSNVYKLGAEQDADQGYAVSKIQMTGQILMKIVGMLTGTKPEDEVSGRWYDNDPIERKGFCDDYILVEDAGLVDEETGKSVEPICSTDSLQMFRIDAENVGKTYRVKLLGENQRKTCEVFGFSIPIADLSVTFDTSKIVAGKQFKIYCKIKGDYQKQRIVEPLKLYVYRKDGKEKELECKTELQSDGENQYEGSICPETEGYYTYEIQTGNGELLRTFNRTVNGAEGKGQRTKRSTQFSNAITGGAMGAVVTKTAGCLKRR